MNNNTLTTYFPQEITPFELRGYVERDNLLLPGQVLVADPENNWLVLLEHDHDRMLPRYVSGVEVTPAEWTIVLPLLVSYPDYLPYEVALCAFTSASVEPRQLEDARARLERAFGIDGQWDQVMRPIRNVMSRVRVKLERKLQVASVRSILETGFQLCPYRYKHLERMNEASDLPQLVGRVRA